MRTAYNEKCTIDVYKRQGEAAGSKLEKANALGIPVLDEAGLKAMVNA